MEDFAYVIRYAIHWATANPVKLALIFVALVVAQWLLNRKTPLEKESDRVVKQLTEGSRGKYDDLRPLR
jgi:hypothetical protein